MCVYVRMYVWHLTLYLPCVCYLYMHHAMRIWRSRTDTRTVQIMHIQQTHMKLMQSCTYNRNTSGLNVIPFVQGGHERRFSRPYRALLVLQASPADLETNAHTTTELRMPMRAGYYFPAPTILDFQSASRNAWAVCIHTT